eukprot:TRINITY_DN18369_c0_g1_i1.p1 TRINITY_DN18369_c0_g1~~TRINITY_DN18369_c0_g1_i1.p1  ORF type:complete len:661 (-),score=96.78 TRINITY_DN18369_c0_g1_i1:199-1941(-)
MLGFGAALTEASALLLNNSPSKGKILDDLFLPPEQGGAGITCLRIPIGSSDFAIDAFTYQADSESDFDASREERLRLPILREIKARSPKIALIATPWSAPAWMKDSGRLEGGTLRDDMVDDYSRMLLETILFYEKKGMPLYAITVQNEPYFQTEGYPSMLLSAQQQGMLARTLVYLLRTNGLSTRVLGHDHNYDLAVNCQHMLRAAGGVLDGTAWHAYGGQPTALDAPAIQKAGGIYVTEQTGHTKRPQDADFHGDIDWMMKNVIMGPVLHGARCGLAWNIALDDEFGPHVPGGPTDCRGVVEIRKDGSHARGPEYYGLMHLCHATTTPQGETSWRVSTASSDPNVVSAVGFISTNHTVSLVLQNSGDDDLKVAVKSSESDEVIVSFMIPGKSLLSAHGYEHSLALNPHFPSDELRVPLCTYSFPRAFGLRSVSHGTLLAAHGDEDDVIYQSDADEVGEWEMWTTEEVSERVFVLRSMHNTYIGRDDDHCLCQVRSREDAAHFLVFVLRSGRICLNTDCGSLVIPSSSETPTVEMAYHSPDTALDVVEVDEGLVQRMLHRMNDKLYMAKFLMCDGGRNIQ